MIEITQEILQKPISMFKALTKAQYSKYIQLVTDDSPAIADARIRKMQDTGTIQNKGNIVSAGNAQFDRKTSAAFWGYLSCFDSAETNFFPTEFPAQMGFAYGPDIFRIVVCDDRYHDREMIALREHKKDDVKTLIVGINIHLADVNPKILPDTPYVYLYMEIDNILTDVPKMIPEKVQSEH